MATRGRSRWWASCFRRPIAITPTPLRTANFITQEDIGGDDTDYINDAELRNAPNTTASRRGVRRADLLITGLVFGKVDRQPTHPPAVSDRRARQAAGRADTRAEFMRLLVAPEQPRIAGEGLDFRDEIMAQIFDRGDPVAEAHADVHIEVTDEGKTTRNAARERRTFRKLASHRRVDVRQRRRLLQRRLVIHFNHPTWRDDRNDPATATRVNRQKVRLTSP